MVVVVGVWAPVHKRWKLLPSPIVPNLLPSNVICICIFIDLQNKVKLNARVKNDQFFFHCAI